MTKERAVHHKAVAVEKVRNRLPLLFLFILISASAYSISSADVSVQLGAASSEVSWTLVLDHQYDVQELYFPLPQQALGIEVYVDDEEGYWWLEGTNLVIDYNKPAGTHLLNIVYNTDLVTYSEKGYLFSFTHTSITPIQEFNLDIALPQHATLAKGPGIPLSPEALTSSDGEHIILSWNKNLAAGETFSAVGGYNPPSTDYGVPLGFLLIAVILVGGAAFFFYKNRTDGKLLLVLSEDERVLYKHVKDNPGISQKEVEKFIGFSKAKLSKLVRNLEQAKLLKKQPYRRTNKLWAK